MKKIETVICLDCGHEQADMGVGVACEECDGPTQPNVTDRSSRRRKSKGAK